MGAAQENVKCEADFHMTHACWCQFLSSGSIIWLDTGAQMEDVWKKFPFKLSSINLRQKTNRLLQNIKN